MDMDMKNVGTYDKQMLWKSFSDAKKEENFLQHRDKEESECTFTPATNKRAPKGQTESTIDDSTSRQRNGDTRALTDWADRNESYRVDYSRMSHVLRQENARYQKEKVKQRQAPSLGEKFDPDITQPKPFNLSKTNIGKNSKERGSDRKKASGSSRKGKSRRKKDQEGGYHEEGTHTESNGFLTSEYLDLLLQGPSTNGDITSDATKLETLVRQLASQLQVERRQWDQERANLEAVLKAQQEELAARQQARSQAALIAQRFASGISSLGDRLNALEQHNHIELRGLRETLGESVLGDGQSGSGTSTFLQTMRTLDGNVRALMRDLNERRANLEIEDAKQRRGDNKQHEKRLESIESKLQFLMDKMSH